MERIELRDQTGILRTFDGELMCPPESGKAPGKHRWVEMRLYAAPRGYVLYRVGESEVYHVHQSLCGKGLPVMAADLPDGAVPCYQAPAWGSRVVCHPQPGAQVVDMEQPRPVLNRCRTAARVIKVLTERKPATGEEYLSGPARRLIEAAARQNPEFRDAWQSVKAPL